MPSENGCSIRPSSIRSVHGFKTCPGSIFCPMTRCSKQLAYLCKLIVVVTQDCHIFPRSETAEQNNRPDSSTGGYRWCLFSFSTGVSSQLHLFEHGPDYLPLKLPNPRACAQPLQLAHCERLATRASPICFICDPVAPEHNGDDRRGEPDRVQHDARCCVPKLTRSVITTSRQRPPILREAYRPNCRTMANKRTRGIGRKRPIRIDR